MARRRSANINFTDGVPWTFRSTIKKHIHLFGLTKVGKKNIMIDLTNGDDKTTNVWFGDESRVVCAVYIIDVLLVRTCKTIVGKTTFKN